jgi:bud emergence protein 1
MVGDIMSATVDSYITQQDQYWFHLTLHMRGRSERSLYRLYEDFYNFQIHLLDTFPAEAGRTGGERILPYMPGPLSFVNDVITSQRRADLDVYVQELLGLPDYVREGELMRGFFGLDEDEEEPIQSEQRLSHKQDRNSGRRANGGDDPVVEDEYSRPQPPAQMLKIKVQYGEDILAIKVPSRATFTVLWDRVRERLGDRVRRLEWKDAKGEYRPLDDSEDFQRALHETQGKLLLIAS